LRQGLTAARQYARSWTDGTRADASGLPCREGQGDSACSERSRPGEEVFAMDERSARLAKNEAIFRAGNESINKAAGGKAPYLCECGEKSCLARVELTPAEYEAVRAHPARFFVVPGHEDLTAGEVVVEQHDRFTVVEKQGEEREVVERVTPQVS
jgi:hypothetical protein